MTDKPLILWFRRDLRLSDHPMLTAAVATGRPLVPVFILDPETESTGAAPKWRLGLGVAAFDAALRGVQSRLILRRGPALAVLQALIAETGADCVMWQRLYDPAAVARDTVIKAALRADGIAAESVAGENSAAEMPAISPDLVRTQNLAARRAMRSRGSTASPLPRQ